MPPAHPSQYLLEPKWEIGAKPVAAALARRVETIHAGNWHEKSEFTGPCEFDSICAHAT